MRSTLLVAVVLVVLVGQGRTDSDGKTEASTKPKKEDQDSSSGEDFLPAPAPQPPAQPKKDDEDVSSDEVDEDPNALDNESCDELWAQTQKEDVKIFTDEIVEWTHLCAMKHGLCPLGEPYWSSGLVHSRIQFSYRHDILTIQTKVSTSLDERCSNPAVDWEKIGEKYRTRDQLRNIKRYKNPYNMHGKRRHQRPSKGSKPE